MIVMHALVCVVDSYSKAQSMQNSHLNSRRLWFNIHRH